MAADGQVSVTRHTLLDRVSEDILRNACKHTPKQTLIDISVEQVKRHIEIQIRDFGPGINDTNLASLMTPFFNYFSNWD